MNRRQLFSATFLALAAFAVATPSILPATSQIRLLALGATQGATKCSKCGKAVQKTWRFCDKCGAKLSPPKIVNPIKPNPNPNPNSGGTTSANFHSGHKPVNSKGLVVATASNLPLALTSGAQIARGLAVNPNGAAVGYGSNAGSTTDVFVVDSSKPLNTPRLVSQDTTGAEFDPDFHPNGNDIIFVSEGVKGGSTLMIENLDGKGGNTITVDGGIIWQPRYSPDGSKIVYVRKESDRSPGDLYILDLATYESRAITSGPANDDSPTWCPTGCHIAFESDRSGSAQIWSVEVGIRAAEAQSLESSDEFIGPLLADSERSGVQVPSHVPTPRQLTKVGPHRRPSWSKRGYIFFESNFTINAMNENGGNEVLVSSLPLSGSMPRVSADGSTLVFIRRQSLGNEAFIIRLK